MALVAVSILQVVVPIDVAFCALEIYMRSLQWEIRVIVIERRRFPGARGMAL